MLDTETYLRLDPEIQAYFRKLENDTSREDWMTAVTVIQEQVVRYHLGDQNIQLGLQALREATTLYPDLTLPFWIRYNRAKVCSVNLGSLFDVPLYRLRKPFMPISLSSLITSTRPIVIIAGSVT